MLKFKKSFLIILITMLALTLVACGNQGADNNDQEKQEVIKIKVALEGIASIAEFADKFKELAEEKLPGKVEIQLYKDAQLGSQKETYEQVELGTLEMAIGASAQVGLEPSYMIFEFPYIFRDRDHLVKVMNSDIPGELNQKLIDSKKIRTLAIADAGFRSISNNIRPINVPDDLKGIKIRTPQSPFRMEIFNSLGATATPISMSDLYISLQQKVVNGSELPVYDIYSSSLYEVQDYLSISNHVYSPVYLITSENWWQGLSEELQTGIEAAAKEAAVYSREIREQIEKEYADKLAEKGMIVNHIDTAAFVAKMQETVWKNYEKEYGNIINKVINIK